MTTVLLVRHGLTAVTGKILLGWTPGVGLDERGRLQAEALAGRLAGIPLAAIVSSPLDRCQQTAAEIARRRPEGPSAPAGVQKIDTDERIGECHYGDWTGQELTTLAKEPLWKVVQAQPSAVTFPGGEALRDTQSRGVTAVREWNERLGPDATWLLCSHGDVIRTVLADALGMHLDMYHRITVDPCSLTVVRYGDHRPFVRRVNDVGGAVADLLPVPPSPAGDGKRPREDEVVGGGAGAEPPVDGARPGTVSEAAVPGSGGATSPVAPPTSKLEP
ncbi:Phosphoglycerate mutase [Parafrankia sp. Ea1.12]|uniref:histidine phosphatase family protein n=1 Tax=Parafrankia sp. Ea1.12 TaxID=573499 RepID=UPI000DA55E6A|nr:histidine phosphatase family protein [Parafrankia sp. Ea1.12]SQD96632.1 Phosphoglycerate mutase [Parafrankia sp. Ea1.12]